MPKILLALFLGLSSLSAAVRAEGGCPPGMIPYSGTNISSCGPIHGYTQQQQAAPQPPPPQWESRWGAIAVGKPGIFGASANMSNQQSAEQSAMADCRAKGGIECELQISYANGCGVLTVGNPGFNASKAATPEEAVQHGLKVCRDAGATNCRAYYSTCSPAVRIR